MKAIACIFIFCLFATATKAGDPYRADLLSKIYTQPKSVVYAIEPESHLVGISAFIPHYETPRGAIFCRMEDKVTKTSKVWLKLGVQ